MARKAATGRPCRRRCLGRPAAVDRPAFHDTRRPGIAGRDRHAADAKHPHAGRDGDAGPYPHGDYPADGSARDTDDRPDHNTDANDRSTPATTKTSTRPAEPTAAASSLSATAASDTSGGLGALGWFVLIILAAALIGGVLLWRSRRSTDWAAEADALAVDTGAVVGRRLPQVLATVTAAQRALSWPPVRADLVDRLGRWALLTENAPGEQRADWSRHVWGLIQEVVTAVDAENEALATGQEWRLLRPRVEDAARALTAALAARQGVGPDTPTA